ncbi:DUF3574 domain-containing protein [Aphanothece hegewaldii CCALA 016]|uniref:DUF3574 domain-containing protein n=1 Tax=Aphanothece hegewaldii CCALA 016 TaxID=2107694 RepID=A0A2T1LXW7_9CHRO|nr:DUF3574 domain-containing protein [Aphanothece hegewaldii CCALA 016]
MPFILCLSLLSPLTPTHFLQISPVMGQEVLDPQKKEWIKVELYFGLSSKTREISEQEWQQFLNYEITPRFPEGLTVIDSYGQYLHSEGCLVKERAKIAIILLKQPLNEQKIQEIIELFKETFQQESVLKVITPVQAEF